MNTLKEDEFDSRMNFVKRNYPAAGLVLGGLALHELLSKLENEEIVSRRGFFRHLGASMFKTGLGAAGGLVVGATLSDFQQNKLLHDRELAADLTGLSLTRNIAAHIAGNERVIELAEKAGQGCESLIRVTQTLKAIAASKGKEPVTRTL